MELMVVKSDLQVTWPNFRKGWTKSRQKRCIHPDETVWLNSEWQPDEPSFFICCLVCGMETISRRVGMPFL